jgi:hypothetical protein
MQKHKPFHIKCKNEEEFILIQKFLFDCNCGWRKELCQIVEMPRHGITYRDGILVTRHGITYRDGILVMDNAMYNPAEDVYKTEDFTINDLPEIKKTLETPVYEVGDWVRIVNHPSLGTFVDKLGTGDDAYPERGLKFYLEVNGDYFVWEDQIERLATPEEISNVNLNIAIERFKKFYEEHGASGVAVLQGKFEEAIKMKCACDCAEGVDSHIVTYYTKTGLSQENREKLKKELLDWYNKKDYSPDVLFEAVMSRYSLDQILNKY